MSPTSRPPRPTTLQIDLDAAAANIRAVRQLVGPGRKIFAVVKADGYGHGAAELGAVVAAHGADALAVADLAEGMRLRQRGISAPILVYPNSLPEAAPDAIAHGLIRRSWISGARERTHGGGNKPCDVFVKVDVEPSGWACRPSEQRLVAAVASCRTCAWPGSAHPRARGADPAYASGSSAGSPPSSTSWRRAVSSAHRLFAASPFVLRVPPDVPQRRDQPDALRHHLPRRGVAGAVTATLRAHHAGHRRQGLARATARRAGAIPLTASMKLGVIPMGSAAASPGSTPAGVLVRGQAPPSWAAPQPSTRAST